MRSQSRSQLIIMWSVTVAALLWFAAPAGAIPLESWDDKIPDAGTRFMVLSEFDGAAVLDKETQLVWEQAPDSLYNTTWSQARIRCLNKTDGGRKGWRLASIVELASLVDPSVAPPGPTLPPGHPFTNIQSARYWSTSILADDPTNAWIVNFETGFVFHVSKAVTSQAWCVRGGMNVDAY